MCKAADLSVVSLFNPFFGGRVMKTCFDVLAVVVLLIGACPAGANTIENPDFNNSLLSGGVTAGVPDGWTAASGSARAFEWLCPWNAMDTNSPDPATPTRAIYLGANDDNPTVSIYQVLSSSVQANTLYTLTVDVGCRKDETPPIAGQSTFLQLGYGSTPGAGTLLSGTYTATTPPAINGWATWTETFQTGSAPPSARFAYNLLTSRMECCSTMFDSRQSRSPNPRREFARYRPARAIGLCVEEAGVADFVCWMADGGCEHNSLHHLPCVLRCECCGDSMG